jgi:hypothetical protein
MTLEYLQDAGEGSLAGDKPDPALIEEGCCKR